jgi:hypothetical protein
VASPWSRALEILGRFVRLGPLSIVTLCVILSATALFGWIVNAHYPIEEWLFWRYAVYWIATGA